MKEKPYISIGGLNRAAEYKLKYFLIFVIHTKIQFDPAHYYSELDTNNTEEL